MFREKEGLVTWRSPEEDFGCAYRKSNPAILMVQSCLGLDG